MENAIMTALPNTTFPKIWNRYTDANSRCHALSGEALEAAMDDERDAIFAMIDADSDDLDAVIKKLTALKAMLKLLGDSWSDQREFKLIDSIKRDLRALARRAA
jgi:hypothetical protein